MKIVLAPNAFKDSLTAREAAEAMMEGIRRALPEADIVLAPVADGGDGLVDVLKDGLGGELVTTRIAGPLFAPVTTQFLLLTDSSGKAAVIEMARASGLALLRPEERNAGATTTKGTGELVKAALDLGARRLVIGLGGSATNDGGMGFASALGAKFTDINGNALEPIGRNLIKIHRIDVSNMDPRLPGVKVEAICDVDNPLCGPRGAAAVFGPQKGASDDEVEQLDAGLSNLAGIVLDQLRIDVMHMPGAGAAGGLGAGLVAFAGAKLRPGVDVVLDLIDFDRILQDADVVFTAEGGMNRQTAHGKGPAGVAQRSRRAGIPCIAVAGSVDADIGNLHELGMDAALSLCSRPMSLHDALTNAHALLVSATEQIFRVFLSGRRGRIDSRTADSLKEDSPVFLRPFHE